jgi:acetyl esterase/lipase
MKSILLIWMTLTLSIVYGQSADDLKRLEEFKKIVNAPVVFPVNDKVKFKITTDLVYNQKQDTSKKLDIYQPGGVSKNKKLPLIIFIHGKTPIETNPKNWGGYKSWAKLIASKGYVAVTFTHSLAVPGKSMEDAASDLEDALDYIKANQSFYNIDTNRIALLAYSAGVPLLSYALIHKQSNIKCLVAFYGFLDMKNIDLWKNESQQTVTKFSLINYCDSDKKVPPLFIARAGKEHNKGLNETIDSFRLKANANNMNITLMNHPAGVHGFDTQNNDERSREIIEPTLLFLRYNL